MPLSLRKFVIQAEKTRETTKIWIAFWQITPGCRKMTFAVIARISGGGLGSLAGSFTAVIPANGRRSYGYGLVRPLISPRRSRLIRTVSIRPEASLQPAKMASEEKIPAGHEDELSQRMSPRPVHWFLNFRAVLCAYPANIAT